MKPSSVEEMERVSADCWGERGAWSYRAFRWANAELFGGALPPVFIQWALTAYGGCIGQTRHSGKVGYLHKEDGARHRIPVVTLHPAIWGAGRDRAAESIKAWGGTPACRLYTLDVVVHELLHVYTKGANYSKIPLCPLTL